MRDNLANANAANSDDVKISEQVSSVDITNMVESLRYARSTKKDNQLEINIKQDFFWNSVDSDDLIIGGTLRFRYGYKERMGKVRLVEIVDLIPEFSERIKLKIIARDKGHTMKKDASNSIYSKKTASQIAIDIAKKHSLKPKVDVTTRIYDDMPQGNRTDYELLRYLATQEDGFQFFVQDDKLFFVKRKYDKKPLVTYTYGDGILMSLKVKARESQQDIASNDVTYVGIDPMTGNPISATSDGKKDANLGKKGIGLYDFKGDSVGTGYDTSGANKTLPDAGGNAADMQNKANALQQQAAMDVIIANFEVIGEPTLEIDELITMSNVGKRYGGNWYITDITDEIQAGGFFKTSGEITKDGTAKPVKLGAEDNTNKVNNEQGKGDKQKKEIPKYNSSGDQVN